MAFREPVLHIEDLRAGPHGDAPILTAYHSPWRPARYMC